MSISSGESENCQMGPIINVLALEENNETASRTLTSDENITDIFVRLALIHMIFHELLLGKPNVARQKSIECIRNHGHLFQTCPLYLKTILLHAFNYLVKL